MNQTVSIGERLREERARLGLSQTAFGEIGGVTKKTQMLYEGGERSPDANYLAAVASAGADVAYVLMGKKNGNEARKSASSIDAALLAKVIAAIEQLLMQAGRSLTPTQKAKYVLDLYRATESGRKEQAAEITQTLIKAA